MSGLFAKTVHQSPVVPSHRPGSATGSRPSKSHSYMVVTMGAVASLLGTCRRRGIGSGAPTRSDGFPCLARPRRRMRHILGTKALGPAGELEQHAIGIQEVHAANKHAWVQLVGDAPFAV